MTKATPGPWKWDGDDLWHFGNGYECEVDPHSYTGISADARLRESESLKANKRLVEAAPELLEACDPDTLEAIADEIGCHQHSARAHSLRVIAAKQRAAITKATT